MQEQRAQAAEARNSRSRGSRAGVLRDRGPPPKRCLASSAIRRGRGLCYCSLGLMVRLASARLLRMYHAVFVCVPSVWAVTSTSTAAEPSCAISPSSLPGTFGGDVGHAAKLASNVAAKIR